MLLKLISSVVIIIFIFIPLTVFADQASSPYSSPGPTQESLPSPTLPPVDASKLDNDFVLTKVVNKATLPNLADSITPSLFPSPATQIGLEENSSFLSWINQFACSIGTFIDQIIGGTFCRDQLILAANKGDQFASNASIEAQSQRPFDITITPIWKNPGLKDSPNQTTGDKDLTNINNSQGTSVGIYSLNMPQLKGIDCPTPPSPDTNSLNNDSQYYASNGALTVGGNIISDCRLPDTNARRNEYNQANFPPGVDPTNKFITPTPP